VGHAVEVRIYAEDAFTRFLPASGVAVFVKWPMGDGIRVDPGFTVGSMIGDRFDPLLATITAHGRTRAEACDRLEVALLETSILGITTNLPFLRWLSRQADVRRGRARTDTIDTTWPDAVASDPDEVPSWAWESAGRLLLEPLDSASGPDPWAGGWRLDGRRIVRLVSGAEERTVALRSPVPTNAVTDGADGRLAIRKGSVVFVDVGGRSVEFRVAPPPDVDRVLRHPSRGASGGQAEVVTPMPGRVRIVHVREGTTVAVGDRLVTLEAMKMEHDVVAQLPGRVGRLLVAVGDQVRRGEVLAVIDS
jgi:acetyl-CoA/propionyl-CoA carboxylase biotin carboxyl carrier protein